MSVQRRGRVGRPPASRPLLPPSSSSSSSSCCLPPDGRAQPEEVACVVHQYLLTHFPAIAPSFAAAACAQLPAFSLLQQQSEAARCLPLPELLTAFICLKQREADDAALVQAMQRAAGGPAAGGEDERKDGAAADPLQSVFHSLTRLLRDYGLSRQQAQTLTAEPCARPWLRPPAPSLPRRLALFPSAASPAAPCPPPPSCSASSSSSGALPSPSLSRKRKAASPRRRTASPYAPLPPSLPVAAEAAARDRGSGVTALFPSAAPPPSAADSPAAPLSGCAAPLSPAAGCAAPPGRSSLLLSIDAEELANDAAFAEQLACRINASIRQAEQERGEAPSRSPSLPLTASSALSAPARLPSLLSSSSFSSSSAASVPPVPEVEAGGCSPLLPPLSDAALDALLDELVQDERFGDAVCLQGPTPRRLQQREEDDGDTAEEEDEEEEEEQTDDRRQQGQRGDRQAAALAAAADEQKLDRDDSEAERREAEAQVPDDGEAAAQRTPIPRVPPQSSPAATATAASAPPHRPPAAPSSSPSLSASSAVSAQEAAELLHSLTDSAVDAWLARIHAA